MSAVAQAALQFHDAGVCVIRATADGSKAPFGAWKAYQQTRPERDEVWQWFQNHPGIGVVAGAISGGLEILDFDDQEIYQQFTARAQTCGLGPLLSRIQSGYEEYSPHGAHLLYRVQWDQIPIDARGNTKLARNTAKKAIIETRGEGGFCIVAPSHGPVHESHQPYHLAHGTPQTIVTITEAERQELHHLARSFEELPQEASLPSSSQAKSTSPASSDSPGNRFNRTADWSAILEPHGWVRVWDNGTEQGWRRPGKQRGISATTNYQDSGFLYVFSTSTQFEAERGYSKFAAYTYLNHDGDFTAAAKTLQAEQQRQLSLASTRQTRLRIVPKNTQYPADIPDTTPAPASPKPLPRRNLTDLGNAERLLDRYGDTIQYCHAWKTWLLWNARYWERDTNEGITRYAVEVVRDIYRQADLLTDKGDRTDLIKHATRSESDGRLSAMAALARVYCPIAPDTLDQRPWLLTTQNGVLDLQSRQFHTEGNPEDYLTRAIPVAYDPQAQCPRWEQFLTEIFGGDAELIRFIQKAVGYTLTGNNQEQCFFLLHGSGANGKSRFLDTLGQLLGEYAAKTTFTTFIKRDYEVIRNDLAALQGVRFVSATEGGEGQQFDEAVIKGITGGDPITARFLHAEYFTYTPQFKIWLATNHRPVIKGSDEAIWRRIHLIPFEVTFPPERRDKALHIKLQAELPGILRWAVDGCLLWQQEGLSPVQSVQAATAEYYAEMNTIDAFIEDRCQLGSQQSCTATELYMAYAEWCKRGAVVAESQNAFGRTLTKKGFLLAKNQQRTARIRQGIGLRSGVI